MEGKNSFLLYIDLLHTIDKLPDDKAGQLLKHILKYVNDLHPETDDLLIQVVFEPIKQQLKRDLIDWKKTCERNKNNGSLGGRPKKEIKTEPPISDIPTKENTFKQHFDSVLAFFSEPYELKLTPYKEQFTKVEYDRFALTIKKIVEDFPVIQTKFKKCMSIGDWKKVLNCQGYAILKPQIKKMLAGDIKPDMEMAYRIDLYKEKEENTVLKTNKQNGIN